MFFGLLPLRFCLLDELELTCIVWESEDWLTKYAKPADGEGGDQPAPAEAAEEGEADEP